MKAAIIPPNDISLQTETSKDLFLLGRLTAKLRPNCQGDNLGKEGNQRAASFDLKEFIELAAR